MNITQIENNLKKLMKSVNKKTFIYDLLAAYYLPKASITRLQKGNLNLSKVPGEISWKKKLFFKEEFNEDVHLTISSLKDELKNNQRFVIVTDYKTLLAMDTLTDDKLDIPLKELPKHYDFFLPWAGMEKATHADENPADVRAAVRMAKLFDEIKKDNPDTSPKFLHSLNIFFSRLLFCYFAEDTNIFEDDQFSHAIESHTSADGSDTDQYLNRLFSVLNTPNSKRGDLPNYLADFPFVNGGLFKDEILCPKFTSKSRQLLIDSGDNNDWSAINPDIFGSMFQAVISPEHRGGLGAHYTSVPNIMKVIEPLFLNDLKEAFEDAMGNVKKLSDLLNRLHTIKIFDPACGSGNFLIIAYKELRKLEIDILNEMNALKGNLGSGTLQFENDFLSRITLNNFYGIELDDFAHEIAKLALWLAEHQMNMEFFKAFGKTNPTLPLKDAGQITRGNACRLDWEEVCPKKKGDEIYILGNPPYLGKKEQAVSQKKDIELICSRLPGYKSLDYISVWFYLAARYLANSSSCKSAFVSTNSICQGEQVGSLWPSIYSLNIEIFFAHTSFMWKNSAKYNAGVAVVIIGLSKTSKKTKHLFLSDNVKITDNISPYLTSGSSTIVSKRQKPISNIPNMANGSMANDDGNFFVSENEHKQLPEEVKKYFRQILGARELFHSIKRYALWLDERNVEEAVQFSLIRAKVDKVREFRAISKRGATQKLADIPYRFGEVRHREGRALIVPGLSAEKRQYLPIDFLEKGEIVSNLAQVIFDFEIWLFSLLSSKMNIKWAQATSGYFKKDLRYSPILSYNNMPVPNITNERKEELTQATLRILEEREKHSEKTLAQLYDPDKMPEGLREAHRLNDEAVERCYRSTPFTSDEERLEYLFKLYEKMIQEEKDQDTLFATKKKTRKKNTKKA